MKQQWLLIFCTIAAYSGALEDLEPLSCAHNDGKDNHALKVFENQTIEFSPCPLQGRRSKDTDCAFILLSSDLLGQQTIELNVSESWDKYYTTVYFTCLTHASSYGECLPDCLIMLPARIDQKSNSNANGGRRDYRGCCCSTDDCNSPSRVIVLHENKASTHNTIVQFANRYNRSVESLWTALINWTALPPGSELQVTSPSKPTQANELSPLLLIAILFIVGCAVAVALLLTYFVKKMREYRRLAETYVNANGMVARYTDDGVLIMQEGAHINGASQRNNVPITGGRRPDTGIPNSLTGSAYPYSNAAMFREALAAKQAELAFPFVDVSDVQLVRSIARGRFGAVCIGRSALPALNGGNPDAQFAVKVLPMANRQSWQTELEVYTLLGQHENILRFLGAGRRGDGPDLYLLTEFHLVGSLYDYLKRDIMTWHTLLCIAHGMASGLAYLHEEVVPRSASYTHQLSFAAPCATSGWRAAQSGSAGVSSGTAATIQSNVTGQTALSLTSQPRTDVGTSPGSTEYQTPLPSNGETRRAKPSIAHRDFKSKNVLLDSALNARIGDFGLALVFAPGEGVSESQPQVGTRLYMAPEVIEGAIQFTRDAFLRIDVYALSLVFWECATRCWELNANPVPPDAPDAPQLAFCEPYKLPFEAALGPSPPLEELKDWVVHKRRRPDLKPEWRTKNEWAKQFCITIQECWDADAEARLSAKCVEERMASLLKASSGVVRPPGSPTPPEQLDQAASRGPQPIVELPPGSATQAQTHLQSQPQPPSASMPVRMRAYEQPSNDTETIALLHG